MVAVDAILGTYATTVTCDVVVGIVQTCVYDDVQVIDITMNRNGEYSSLKTSSNVINIYPDIEGIYPDSGMPDDGEFLYGLGSFVVTKIKEVLGLGNDNDFLRTFITIIIALFICIAVVFAIVIFIKFPNIR